MAQFVNQFRQVFRRLARAPLFTAITLLTLAVGIGANIVVFSVVYGVLLKPLSYPHSEQLVGIWYKSPRIGIPKLNITPSFYFINREQSTTIQDIGVFFYDSVSVTGMGQPEQVQTLLVTDGALPLPRVKPMLGRLFITRDDAPDAPKTMILTHGYWQRRFGASRSVMENQQRKDPLARAPSRFVHLTFLIAILQSQSLRNSPARGHPTPIRAC